jgi:hypothetical protein
MDVALLAARVVLALVFGVAGLAKLADRAGSRQALRDFGVPGWVAHPVGVLLPLVELGDRISATEYAFYFTLLARQLRVHQQRTAQPNKLLTSRPIPYLASESTKFRRVSTISGSGSRTSMG